jgi:hypothetical protein
MSQVFNPVFNPADVVFDTMLEAIDENFDAIRTKFSGTSEPTQRVQYQWWFDESIGILKLRNATNSAWLDFYDINTEEILLKDGQVTQEKIDIAARKPSLIEGQAIGPASCTIKTKFTGVSIPGYPQQLFDMISGFGRIDSTGWFSLISTRIYVPDDAEMFYVTAKQETCKMRFVIGSSISTESDPVPGPAWGDETSLDVSSLNGWQDLEIQGFSSEFFPPYGGFSGIVSRWGE